MFPSSFRHLQRFVAFLFLPHHPIFDTLTLPRPTAPRFETAGDGVIPKVAGRTEHGDGGVVVHHIVTRGINLERCTSLSLPSIALSVVRAAGRLMFPSLASLHTLSISIRMAMGIISRI